MTNTRILVVEDDRGIRTALTLMLEFYGYTVFQAENGEEGLKQLAVMPDPPAVILLDLMMPVMDGWAFGEAIAAKPGWDAIPIIVITAFPERADHLRNSVAVVSKPVDIDLLISLVRKYDGSSG